MAKTLSSVFSMILSSLFVASLSFVSVFLSSATATAHNGDTGESSSCLGELATLKAICQSQKLIDGNIAQFSDCSSGFSYYFTKKLKGDSLTTDSGPVLCKVTELRNEKSLRSKSTYISRTPASSALEKTVVYEHTNGLLNTFVYGHTGFYHISETESGDSLYEFHLYAN